MLKFGRAAVLDAKTKNKTAGHCFCTPRSLGGYYRVLPPFYGKNDAHLLTHNISAYINYCIQNGIMFVFVVAVETECREMYVYFEVVL